MNDLESNLTVLILHMRQAGCMNCGCMGKRTLRQVHSFHDEHVPVLTVFLICTGIQASPSGARIIPWLMGVFPTGGWINPEGAFIAPLGLLDQPAGLFAAPVGIVPFFLKAIFPS